MPTFSYQPLGGNGSAGAALIDAPDRAAAVRALRGRGITPVRVELVGERAYRNRTAARAVEGGPIAARSEAPAFSEMLPARARGGMSKAEMSTFIRELATAVRAGLPLVMALRTIARQNRAQRQLVMLNHLIHEVEHGKSLGEAAASWGRPFTELVVNLIRAGEVSGRLGEVLEQAANLLDREVKMRRSLAAGMVYPVILAMLIAIAIGVIVGFIVPRMLSQFAGKVDPSKLPWPTRVVTGFGHVIGGYWWAIAIAVVALWMAIRSLYTTPSSRLEIDRGLLRVPLLGKVLSDVAVARFTRTLGTLVAAGLPALPALKITRGTLGNKAMEQVIDHVCDQVAAGKTIADPMERSGYFPPLLTQIIGLGERSGRLREMLLQAAGVFEDRTEGSLKIFTATFPVVLVLIAAVVIMFVMAAVLLPLIQMQDLIGS